MATKKKSAWAKFPHDASAFDFAGDRLKKAWPALHAGDREPFPDARRAGALIAAAGKAAPKGLDAAGLAAALQDAWRAFHRGEFQQAHDAGVALGPVGASVAAKALGIHATYLVDDEDERLARYEAVGRLAEAAMDALPDEANSHYRYAFGMGRYSQGISIARALKLGLATKVRRALDRTLELEPRHAEAHTALGLYHAEIIAKVGSLVGGLTYGARAADAGKHLEQAMKLTPAAPIVHVEHANLLLLLHGAKGEDRAADAFEKAGALAPRDAMEALDAGFARAQLG